jgi:1-acyl-sn-glycerol-3-phosphate acyltransferase
MGARTLAMSVWTAGITQTAIVLVALRPPSERHALNERWVQRWAQGLLEVFGVQVVLASAPPPPAHGARLVVANHRSPLDILLMLGTCGGSVLGRHDLEHWPLLGWAARRGNTIFVNREDPQSGVKAIREIRRRLQHGDTVIVFPEGTTHRGDEVRPLQGGAFSAVRGLAAELLPVGIAYTPGAEFVNETFVEHLTRMARRPRTRVALCFGAPVPATQNRADMALDMQHRVQTLVDEARRALE